MANLRPATDVPNGADPAFVSYKTQRLAGYDKFTADALGADNDLCGDTRIVWIIWTCRPTSRRRARCRGAILRQMGGAGGGANALLGDAVIAAALKPIADSCGGAAGVDGVADYKGACGGRPSAVPEVALTAWRKLGAAAVTEETPGLG